MSARGDGYDNAVAESFFATLEFELITRNNWTTKAEARRAIFRYIETWCNPRRRHSTLGYISPAEYEAAAAGGRVGPNTHASTFRVKSNPQTSLHGVRHGGEKTGTLSPMYGCVPSQAHRTNSTSNFTAHGIRQCIYRGAT